MPGATTLKAMLPPSLRWQLARFRDFVFQTDFQDILQLDPATLPPCTLPANVRFKPAKDMASLLAIRPHNKTECRFAERRLAAGDEAIIGHIDGTPAFFGWTSRNRLELTFGVFLETPPANDWLFCYNLYTIPAWRRRGLACAFYRWLAQRELAAGRNTRLLAGVDRNNPHALAMHRKAGFQPLGSCNTIWLFGIGLSHSRLPRHILPGHLRLCCAGRALRLA